MKKVLSLILICMFAACLFGTAAGCAEAAKAASENPKAVKNWEALEHALDAVLK